MKRQVETFCRGDETARIIESLKAGDASAWEIVRERSVRVEMNRFRNSEVVRRSNFSEEDLLAMLFDEMVGRGKLSLYRGEGVIYGWLGKYVVGYIYRSDWIRSREVPLNGEHVESVAVIDEQLPCRDLRRHAERCFKALWRRNPVRAYVYYLKQWERISSREIKELLQLSSEANVDKLASRFKRDLGKMVAQDA